MEKLEDLIAQTIQANANGNSRMDRLEEQMNHLSQLPQAMLALTTQIQNMEFRLGQVASSSQTREKGKFPSTTEVNPREHCNAITLRSGTNYEGPSMPQEDDDEGKVQEEESKSEEFELVDVRDDLKEQEEKKDETKKDVWVPSGEELEKRRSLRKTRT
ncbi:hypothetical protein ACS0TY_031321 [Phlomoides rotata]